jgi:hypothetical protein
VAQYNVNDAGSQTTVTDVSQIDNAAVPEPSSLSLIVLGLGSLLALRRCRKI